MKKKFLVFHSSPHADEAVTRLLLQELFPDLAEARFPGISTAVMAPFAFSLFPSGKTEKDFPEHLFIGCGKGRFDEHNIRQRKGCAATIIAQHLGVHNRPGLQKTLANVLYEDEHASRVSFEIPMMVKMLHQMTPDADKVIRWAMLVYRAEIEKETELWAKGEGQSDLPPLSFAEGYELLKRRYPNQAEEWNEFGRAAIEARKARRKEAKPIVASARQEQVFLAGRNQPLQMMVVTSDNDQVATVAFNSGVSVLVKQRLGGNVVIMTRGIDQICLSHVAPLLRDREQVIRGRVRVTDYRYLQSPDTLPQIPEWHLMDLTPRQHLFNGTDAAATAVEPTVIPLDEIIKLVKQGLAVEPSREQSPRREETRRGDRQDRPSAGHRKEKQNTRPENQRQGPKPTCSGSRRWTSADAVHDVRSVRNLFESVE